MSLPSSYRSRRGHVHLPRVLPLVGCRSKTPTQVPVQVDGASNGSGSGIAQASRPHAEVPRSALLQGSLSPASDLLFRPRFLPSVREDEADSRVRLQWRSARWRAQAPEGRRSRRRRRGGIGRRGKKKEWERRWVVTSPIGETLVILSHCAAYQTRV
jgi:hypothetical protein